MSQPSDPSDPFRQSQPSQSPFEAPQDGAPQYGQPQAGQPQYGSGYGAAPQYPTAPGQSSGSVPPPPQTITAFVWIMIAGAVVGVISTVWNLANIDDVTGTDAAAATEVGVVVGQIVGALVSLALWLAAAWLVRKGYNWARITGTVLGAINVISSIVGVFLGTGLAVLLAFVTLLICIAGLVVLWLPQTNAWFQQVAAARRGQMYA